MRERRLLQYVAVVTTTVVALLPACKGTEPLVPTTVTLDFAAVTFDALGATQQLTATVKDQNGNTIANATVTWSSSNTAVAAVSGTGVVTAVTSGTADVRASSGSVQSPVATVTVALLPTLVLKVSGDLQGGTVGQALGAALVVLVQDRLANPIPNQTVNFSVTQGGGSVGTATATTAANGQAQTTWTLGTAAGTNHQVTASAPGGSAPAVTFGATATAAAAAAIVLVSGSGQQGIINQPLPAPIVVRVNDQFGNAVSGRTVDFVVTSGGGSPNPASAATGANGQAQTIWTLGSSLGSQTLEAQASGLTGSPVPFGVTATDLQITAIAPDTLVEGQSATITGTGFSATPANNAVSVGGAAATVSAATTTSLTITAPQTNCQPARDAGVTVTVSSVTSNSFTKRVHPASFLPSLAVGQQVIIQDPTQFCLQFRPSTSGGDAYLVGVGASAETPTATLPFLMSGVAGASAAGAAVVAARPLPVPAAAPGGAVSAPKLEALGRRVSQMRFEQTLRAWEREFFGSAAARSQVALRRTAQAPMVVPSVGDIIPFRVLTFTSPFCSNFVQIGTKVRVVGAAGIWVTDTLNPTTDSLTLAEIQAYSDTFDTKIYATDTLYFGLPSDLDANSRIFIVLTIQVNKIPLGAAGFVFGGDLVSSASCAASNFGEIFYSHVPDPGNTAGTGARSKASILDQMPSLIAHEFAHNIQDSRRLVLAAGIQLSSWEAEGQATLAEEVVGHSVLGNMQGQNYGSSVARGAGTGTRWYEQAFLSLAQYYGWLGGTSKATNAPELCTLFGSTSLTGPPCDVFAFYGASWAFQRYLADRFGAGYPGTLPAIGEARLHRDWIGKSPTVRGVTNVEALLGLDFDSLFTQWAAMLYVDGRVGGAPAALSMASWDMFNVFSSFSSDALRLVPPSQTFAAFADSRSVRGGSNAYTVLSAAGARPALGLRVRDASDATLGTGMRPQLWIVRLQ